MILEELIKKENELDEKLSNDIVPTEFKLKSKIQKESINLGFKSFMEEIGNLEYKIPKYQRSYVWKKNQIEALVFSLLMDYPIPPIYVYVDPKTKERYILDGQQRVISLYLYFSGHTLTTTDLIDFNKILPSTQDFKEYLNTLNNEEFDNQNGKHLIHYIKNSVYKKKLKNSTFNIQLEKSERKCFDLTYKELSREVIIELNKKTLNIVTVKTIEEKDDNNTNRMEYCEIFNLLNNGGTPLKPQEIRNAIYSSNFYDMLHNVSENANWKGIVGKEHKHSKHVELLLRFCALYKFTTIDNGRVIFKTDKDGNSKYPGTYPKFLNMASEQFRKYEQPDIDDIEKKLVCFINSYVPDIDGQKFSALMLEGLFVISQHKEIDIIDKNLKEKILNTPSYRDTINSSTASKTKIEERLNIIYENC